VTSPNSIPPVTTCAPSVTTGIFTCLSHGYVHRQDQECTHQHGLPPPLLCQVHRAVPARPVTWQVSIHFCSTEHGCRVPWYTVLRCFSTVHAGNVSLTATTQQVLLPEKLSHHWQVDAPSNFFMTAAPCCAVLQAW
jgi:hypothetical protein